jgi:hypothetical protein
MIQLLITIDISKGAAEVLRCDGLIKSVEVPLEKQKDNPKLGIVRTGTDLIAVIKTVAEVCEEATERHKIKEGMTKIEGLMSNLSDMRGKDDPL